MDAAILEGWIKALPDDYDLIVLGRQLADMEMAVDSYPDMSMSPEDREELKEELRKEILKRHEKETTPTK